MDKNTFTGLFLIMIIMGVSVFLWKPSDTDLKKDAIRIHADSVKKGLIPKTNAIVAKSPDTSKTLANKKVDSALLKQPFGASTVGTEKMVTLENADVIVKLSTLGGKVSSVELKNYKTYNHKPLILFDGEKSHFGLNFSAGSNSIKTDNLYFTPSADQLQVAAKDSGSVTMRLSYSPTQYIDYIYSLKAKPRF